MKKFALMAALAVLMLAGGCVAVRLDYAVDNLGGATAEWHVQALRPAQGGELADSGMRFARDCMNLMASQWEARGIATETVDTYSENSLVGRRMADGGDGDAFPELERWLKDDASPFSAVTTNHIVQGGAQEYYVDATLDWQTALDGATLASAPAELQAAASSLYDSCTISVSFSLPGRAVAYEGTLAEAENKATCTVKTAPGVPARIMLHTRMEKAFLPQPRDGVDTLFQWAPVAVCAVAGIISSIFAIRALRKIKRLRYK